MKYRVTWMVGNIKKVGDWVDSEDTAQASADLANFISPEFVHVVEASE